MTTTAATRLFALLGDPVGHSLSPVFQNAAIRHLGLDAVYVALRCSADDAPGLIRSLARAGGGGNVTVPHKQVAARAVDVASDRVVRTGACNAFWLADGRVHGDNTDVAGVDGAVRALLGCSPAGASVLLLGAGGAASAAVCALADAGVERIFIVNRTPERSSELAERFRTPSVRIDTASSADDLRGGRFDLAINSTSLGLKPGDPLPLHPQASTLTIGVALDLVYSPSETHWVHEMRACGIPAADGKEMLIQQGAAAFRHWFGVDAPVDVMRAALRETSRQDAS
ncbi:shikimate dehydrogenase [Longimicrobium sp.]|uniref:shikimate dehydrogenase n=1 Tax=Longimicrobium sp. TaxID=2029185 RepID=UPI002F9266BA